MGYQILLTILQGCLGIGGEICIKLKCQFQTLEDRGHSNYTAGNALGIVISFLGLGFLGRGV